MQADAILSSAQPCHVHCHQVKLHCDVAGWSSRAYCAWSRCGWGLFGHFFSSTFSVFYIPLWETARYRLKYCLKGPLNQKQPTNVAGSLGGRGGRGMHKSHRNSVAQLENTMLIPVCCLISRNVALLPMFLLLKVLSAIFKIFILSMILEQVLNFCRILHKFNQ